MMNNVKSYVIILKAMTVGDLIALQGYITPEEVFNFAINNALISHVRTLPLGVDMKLNNWSDSLKQMESPESNRTRKCTSKRWS